MRKTVQRIMAFVLCLIMGLSVFPIQVRATGGIKIDYTNFPDWDFRDYVGDKFDTDGDGYLSDDEIS